MKLRNILIILTAAAVLVGCSSRRDHPADVEYDSFKNPYHVVRRGETIASIASGYHIDKRELVRLNGMKPPYRIVIGQKLLVGAHGQVRQSDLYSPAQDAAQKGEVTVSTLAPLPGTEDEASSPNADDQSNSQEQTEEVDQDEDSDDAEADTAAEEPKTYKPLGEAPSSAAFYTWPVRGKIIKGFSSGKGGHSGINISAPKGTPVKAANNGVVSRTEQIPGYGKVILIRHQNGFITVYAHLDQIVVKRGQTVEAGQKIGTVGKSGNVKEPQLHFKINKGKTPVDPTKYLD